MTRQKVRTLLSTRKQGTVLFQTEVDFNKVCTGEELHDHARGNDRTDTKFHESTAVGGKDDTHPVQRVRRVGGHDAVEWDLGADQEDEESDRRP